LATLRPFHLWWSWVLIDILVDLCKSLVAGADLEERRGSNRPSANYPIDG